MSDQERNRRDYDENVGVMISKMDTLSRSMDKLTDKFDELGDTFVTQKEFKPVRNFVYGLISITMVSVLVGILSYVVLSKSSALDAIASATASR